MAFKCLLQKSKPLVLGEQCLKVCQCVPNTYIVNFKSHALKDYQNRNFTVLFVITNLGFYNKGESEELYTKSQYIHPNPISRVRPHTSAHSLRYSLAIQILCSRNYNRLWKLQPQYHFTISL